MDGRTLSLKFFDSTWENSRLQWIIDRRIMGPSSKIVQEQKVVRCFFFSTIKYFITVTFLLRN